MGPGLADQHFIGMDVQSAKDCPYAVLDGAGQLVQSGWVTVSSSLERELNALLAEWPTAIFGIDAPRVAVPSPREWYWGRGQWRPRRTSEVGNGRHCEVVVKAHNIANPQWTPLKAKAKSWMQIGFRIFELLQDRAPAHEVFPSASYSLLQGAPEVRVALSFEHFRPGPKDMLDAAIGALTAREFEAGRGAEVGGGDGLGTIVLPRPIPRIIEDVLSWPGAHVV